MRILRGKSSSEVSSQGFALFVVGLVLATFLGGAVKTLLNSDAIQKRLLNEAQKRWPDVSIEIGKMQGLLSQGMWPGLVFQFENLHIIRRSCRTDSLQVDIEKMRTPINLWSLWRGRPRLGEVEAEGVRIHLFRQPCANENAVSEAGGQAASGEAVPASQTTEPRKLNLNWAPLRNTLNGLELSNLEFTSESEPSLKTVIHRLNARVGSELHVQGEVELKKSLPFGPSSHVLNLNLRASESAADFSVAGKFKEGQLEWRGTVDLVQQTFHQEWNIQQVPMKDLLAELYKIGVFDKEMVLKSFWLSCQATHDGVLSNWQARPLFIKKCKLDGSQGKIELGETEIPIRREFTIEKPIVFNVVNFQLAPLLEAGRRDTLPKVFSKLGAFSGQFTLNSREKWSVVGDLTAIEVIFSNQSVRGKQIVNSVHTELNREGENVSGRLSAFDFQDGVVDGEASVRLDPLLKTGVIDLRFKEFLLSPAVQRILYGGVMKSLSVQGQGRLLQGDLEIWTGSAQSEQVSGSDWALHKVSARTQFKNGSFRIDATASEFVAEEKWSQLSAAKTVYRQDGLKKINWRDLSVQMDVSAKGGEIIQFTSRDAVARLKFVAHGRWARDHDFIGSLNVTSDQSKRIFSLLGRQNQLTIHQE